MGIIERARPCVNPQKTEWERRVAARNVDSSFSFVIHIVVISNRRRTIEAHPPKCPPEIRHDESTVSQWICRSREPMRNKNGEIKTFLVKTSSESLPSRRNDTTLALLQPQPLFLSRFHSFPLRGRKFVFVSKSGRLALKKNVCAFGTYIGETESRAGARVLQ